MTIEYKDSKRIVTLGGATYYEETDANSGASMSNGGIYYAYGTEIRAGNSSITKKADKWTIRFGRNNSPQGVVEAHIYTGTEGATSKTHSQTSTNSVAVDALSTSDADYSFTFATPHTISAGDVFAIVWKTDTSTSGSNYINIRLFNALTDMPNTRNYMVSTANWDGSDDDGHTWSVAPSPYTTYTLTSKLELIDQKTLITDVQDNSILVEKDTGKRYWFSKDPAFTPEQLTGGSNRTVFGDNNEAHFGIKVSTGSVLIGKTISQVSFRLKQNQSPSSSNLVYVRVWRSGSFSHTFGTTAPSNIAVGTYAFYSFGTGGDFATSSDGSITIQDGDRIVLSWDRGDGGNNEYIHMEFSSSDVYDGVKTGVALSNTASPTQESDWSGDDTGDDIVFKLVGTEPSTWVDPSIWIRALFMGGNTTTYSSAIDYITIDNKGNSSSFGDLTQARWELGGASDSTRAVAGGGLTTGTTWVNTMDYVTIATTGNATDFGDLTYARRSMSGCSNDTRGIFSGGRLS
jgi:hypothetical protein